MNTDNINALIAHVAAMEKSIPHWGPEHCIAAMVDAVEGRSFPRGRPCEFLGIDFDQWRQLRFRRNDPAVRLMHAIGEWPLDEQKRVITHALVSLRDTGKVEWLK